MEILGIGPMELFFIVVLAIIVLGPKDMAKAGRTVGKFLRDLVQSDYYKAFNASTKEIRNLPNRLMREANLDDDIRELDRTLRAPLGDPNTYTIRPPSVPDTPVEPVPGNSGGPVPIEGESGMDQARDPKA